MTLPIETIKCAIGCCIAAFICRGGIAEGNRGGEWLRTVTEAT